MNKVIACVGRGKGNVIQLCTEAAVKARETQDCINRVNNAIAEEQEVTRSLESITAMFKKL